MRRTRADRARRRRLALERRAADAVARLSSVHVGIDWAVDFEPEHAQCQSINEIRARIGLGPIADGYVTIEQYQREALRKADP